MELMWIVMPTGYKGSDNINLAQSFVVCSDCAIVRVIIRHI
jgi:hypothetical protein